MSLSRDDVCHIARLARLEFEAEELDDFVSKLGDIVAFVDQLQAVDLDGVEPMAHPLDQVQRLRDDRVTATIDRDRYQRDAERVADGLYLVPRVIE